MRASIRTSHRLLSPTTGAGERRRLPRRRRRVDAKTWSRDRVVSAATDSAEVVSAHCERELPEGPASRITAASAGPGSPRCSLDFADASTWRRRRRDRVRTFDRRLVRRAARLACSLRPSSVDVRPDRSASRRRHCDVADRRRPAAMFGARPRMTACPTCQRIARRCRFCDVCGRPRRRRRPRRGGGTAPALPARYGSCASSGAGGWTRLPLPDEDLDVDVAVRCSAGDDADVAALEQIRREARAAARFRGPRDPRALRCDPPNLRPREICGHVPARPRVLPSLAGFARVGTSASTATPASWS